MTVGESSGRVTAWPFLGLAVIAIAGILGWIAISKGRPQGQSDSTPPSAAQSAPTPQGQKGTLDGDDAAAYVIAGAKKLIVSWRPVPFTGELAPYDPERLVHPDLVVNPADDKLLDEACRSNRIWRRTRSFHERMEEIPGAVATPSGAVIYTPLWEKGSDGQRVTYLGVRVQDHACGGFDNQLHGADVDGDADVIAALVAAAAIKSGGITDDRQVLSPSVQDRALAAADAVLGSPPAAAADAASQAPRTYSAGEFRQLVLGKTRQQVIALLGRPLAVHDSGDGSQAYDYSSDETYLGRVAFTVRDETTGITLRSVNLEISADGRVARVNF